MLWLNPFIDENGVLRVGGRLKNAQTSSTAKHPIILPSEHAISHLLIQQYHFAHLHAGPTLLSNILRQEYWIVGGKKLIRKYIHKCVGCIRFRGQTRSQLMGDLPEPRVRLERPFTNCENDFARPIVLKFNKGQGEKQSRDT